MGIIGKPYMKKEDSYVYQPEAFFSHCDVDRIFHVKYAEISDQLTIPYELQKCVTDTERFSICSSRNRLTEQDKEDIEKLKPTALIPLGGAGNKLLNII